MRKPGLESEMTCERYHGFLFSSILPNISSVQFSSVTQSFVSNSLRPHGLQHARPPCPSPTPEACSNSCPSSQWHHPTISSSVVPFSSCLQSFSASGSFPMSTLRIRWPKYWSFSFSISPSNEYSGLSLHTQIRGSDNAPQLNFF